MVSKGQRYRALRDLPVFAFTHWFAPFTGGYHVVLRAGEVFVIGDDPVPTAKAANCLPERYHELHEVFIPKEDRQAENYSGYSLSIDLDRIREDAGLLP